jgi:hypothetical protein
MPKVGKTALLKDRGFYVPTLFDLRRRVNMARFEMAQISRVPLSELAEIHTGQNGRRDCDNYAAEGCAILKAQFDADCREHGWDHQEYGIHEMSRADMNHTQALCLTQAWFYIVDFIDGRIVAIKEDHPQILFVRNTAMLG